MSRVHEEVHEGKAIGIKATECYGINISKIDVTQDMYNFVKVLLVKTLILVLI